MFSLTIQGSITKFETFQNYFFSRPGPLVGGDAAIIDDMGNILLIKRTDNNKWAMPGGLFQVGETPAEGVIREAFEETGITCQVDALAAVYDSRFCGTSFPLHMYQFLFLCSPLKDKEESFPTTPQEVKDKKWFSENNLPLNIDPGHISKIPEAYRVWKGDKKPYFDTHIKID